MKPTIAAETDVYFLAEAPGQHEDETSGRPLTGPSGKLLRECIPEGQAKYCSFDNVVRDRPENNRTPTWQEIECCRGHITKSIEQAKPKLIVGLGAIPLSWMLNSTDMAGMRGRLFVVKVGTHTCYFLPTYHPSFILGVAYDKRKPLNSKMGNLFRDDINLAFDLVSTLDSPICDSPSSIRSGIHAFDGSEDSHFEELKALLKQAIKAPIKAIDLETKGLRPYAADAAIMTAAVSFDDIHFSFAIDHPKSGWAKPQLEQILILFERLLKNDTIKVAHNASFEIEWLQWLFGRQVVNHLAWHCTMMQSHFLDERKGGRRDEDTFASKYQSLDFLVHQHFGIAFKGLFKLNKKDMAKSDLSETLIYNAVDTRFTLRLFLLQKRLLKKQGLQKAYLEATPCQATVALIQSFGVGVDQTKVKWAQKELQPKIDAQLAEINSLKVVKAYIKDKKEFNPYSGRDVISIFKDYLGRKEVTIKSEGMADRLSVDKNILAQIDHPLASMILNLRNKSTIKATFVDGLELGVGKIIYPDGKLHTSFNTCQTETGRLSSSEPNLQNYPKRNDAWVRQLIVPPKGHIMLAVDYGQLEACTGAMCSKDAYLVNALWNDYDIHQEWAERIAHKAPELIGGKENIKDKIIMKKFRALVKNKMVFPSFFGATNESVCEYMSGGTGQNVDQSMIDEIMSAFWATFEGVKKWQDRTMKMYYDVGYVETLGGRRRHKPLSRNQAINAPVQGSAAELVRDSMVRMSMLAAETNQWHLHPILNVHDDLSYFVPDDDKLIEEAILIIMKQMLTFDFTWVNVPMSIEISIGPNWADLEPVGKFWSHKEFNYPNVTT